MITEAPIKEERPNKSCVRACYVGR